MPKNLPFKDIVIIGSGASGGACAWRLSSSGASVLVLEQGPWFDKNDYPGDSNSWEIKAKNSFDFNPNVRKLDADYEVLDKDSDIHPLMYNAVGGSTHHWTAHTPRFHPSDFRVKSLDGVADDWPISYWDIEKYYDINDEMMGCSGIDGDPANPPKSKRQMPPLPLGPDGERIAKAADRLGWHWWPSDSYQASEDYKGRVGWNNHGTFASKKKWQSIASTDHTYINPAVKNGLEVRANSVVQSISVDNSGKLKGVVYLDDKGVQYFQEAGKVIVACNGIGTPRLLLNSKSKAFPEGLANSSGLVGKNLMFHPYAAVSGIFDEDDLNYSLGPLANIIIVQEFYETDESRNFVRGYSFQMNRSHGPAHTALGAGGAGKIVPWGKDHHSEFKKRFKKFLGLAVISEDLPELHNRVELDEKLTDRHGIPLPKVFYKTSENTRKLLDHGIDSAKKLLEEAGCYETNVVPTLESAGWHLMGTAKMGNDPKTSVVDANCKTHDVDNLYIIDGSVFTTSAAVNPTPTIQAVALRAADKILQG